MTFSWLLDAAATVAELVCRLNDVVQMLAMTTETVLHDIVAYINNLCLSLYPNTEGKMLGAG